MGSTLLRLTYRGLLLALLFSWAPAAFAQEGRLSGTVTDSAGAAVVGATVDLINLASNAIRTTKADAAGKYEFASLPAGQYRLVVKAPGYNDHGRTLTVESALTEDVALSVGNIKEVITVTADRGLKADQDIPLNVTVQTAQSIEEKLPVSPGEVLKDTPSLFVFNSSSHLSSPNLRGLQSSRVQIVVDGERVNNSRTEIQTFGSNLGSFIDTYNVENAEVVAGAGSSLYGTDSLVGTVNFTTKAPPRPDQGWVFGAKFGGLYSTNETGRKGNVTLNISNPRVAFNLSGSMFRFANYHFGTPHGGTVPLQAVQVQQDRQKQLQQDNGSRQDFALTDEWHRNYLPFGVPENGDATTVYNSQSHGASGFFNLWLHPAKNHSIRYKQSNIHLGLYGYPNHTPPNHHDLQFASFDKTDRYGVRYQGVELNRVITRVAAGYYWQKLIRPIDNISFATCARPIDNISSFTPNCLGTPAPAANRNALISPTASPVSIVTADGKVFLQSVGRPQALTFNKQVVVSNAADVQVSFQLMPKNSLLVGYQFWRDTNADEFSTTSFFTTPGQVVNGVTGKSIPKFAPFAGYYLNPATAIYGQGVANGYNQESAFFFADEYDPTNWLRFQLSYRYSRFNTLVNPSDGFPLTGFNQVVAGPFPVGIDPSGITPLAPVINKTGPVSFPRNVHTGSLAIIGRPRPEISVFGRVGNSLRLPALIEANFFRLFPAGTLAFIFVPNGNLKPERSVNVDTGVKLNYKRFRAGLTYYNNTYTNFIEQTPGLSQIAAPDNPTGRLGATILPGLQVGLFLQRFNTGRARTQGLEAEYEVPFGLGAKGTISVTGIMSWQKGRDLAAEATFRQIQRCFLERQNDYNNRYGKIFDFGTRSGGNYNPNNSGICGPGAGTRTTPAQFDDIPFERIVPFMLSKTIRWQEQKGRLWSEFNIRAHSRITRVDPDISANPGLRFNYFTFRSLAGVTLYNLRGGYSWYGENSHISFSVAVDNLSNKFYTEPFQFAAARGRSVAFGLTLEAFDLLKAFRK